MDKFDKFLIFWFIFCAFMSVATLVGGVFLILYGINQFSGK